MEEKRKDTYIWPDLAVSSMEAAQPGEETSLSIWRFRVRKDGVGEEVSVDQRL